MIRKKVSLNFYGLKHRVTVKGAFALFIVFLVFHGGILFPAEQNQGQDQDLDSTVFFNGKPYLKINTAELYYLLKKGDMDKKVEAFVVRGIVKRSAELDRMGQFALLRVNMVCCAADAMAMGVTVSSKDLDKLSDGEWVRVFGKMRPLQSAQKLMELPTLDSIPYTMIYDKAVLRADEVEIVGRPEAPYMFELPGDTGYHY
jgi:hypothetical protein